MPCVSAGKFWNGGHENVGNTNNTEIQETKVTYSVEYILAKMTEIQSETAYLYETLTKLAAMSDGDSGDCGAPGNILGQEKAKAFGDIVRCRETTNQQLLKMYEKMLDSIISEKSSFDNAVKWNAIQKLADVATNEDDFASERAEMLDSIRQILRENK